MNLFCLRYFVKLAEVRHYTKAAEQLCITQPSLSHAIAQLEAELGVALFEKSGRNTALTPFGEEFLVCARRTLETLDEGVGALKRSACGDGLIRLGFLRTLGADYVPRLAADFLAANPGRDIRFTFHTGATGELLEGLEARKYDLVFCSKPPQEQRLTAVPVGNQQLVLIVPKGHALAGKQAVELAEAADFPQIWFAEGSGMRGVAAELFEKAGRRPRIAYETEEDEVIAGLVSCGFGVAVVPYMELLNRLDVSVLQIQSPAVERNFYMVHDGGIYMPPAVRLFREFVIQGRENV